MRHPQMVSCDAQTILLEPVQSRLEIIKGEQDVVRQVGERVVAGVMDKNTMASAIAFIGAIELLQRNGGYLVQL